MTPARTGPGPTQEFFVACHIRVESENRATSSEAWSSCASRGPGDSVPDDGALSQANCIPRLPIQMVLRRAA